MSGKKNKTKTKTTPAPPGPADLKVGIKAVQYEVVTLVGQMDRMAELQALKKAGKAFDAVALNSLLESTLVHLRALRDFFTASPKDDDVAAEHFFPPSKTPVFKLAAFAKDDVRKRLNKHLAHISYDRRSAGKWNTDALTKEILGFVRQFDDAVDPKYRIVIADMFSPATSGTAPSPEDMASTTSTSVTLTLRPKK